MDALVSYVRRIIPPTETHFIVPSVVFPLAGASIDLWFTASRYYDSSAGGEGQAITDYLSCSRASIGYAKTSAGTLTQFANNELRITTLGLLVEDSRTNLATESETFSTWTSDEATVTANQTTAPNGAVTGAKLMEGTNFGSRQSIRISLGSLSATSYTASCYLKQGTQRYGVVCAYHDSTPEEYYTAVLDLQTGTIVTTSSAGSTVGASASVEALADGWYRLLVTRTYSGAAGGAFLKVALSNSSTPSYSLGVPAYNGGGTGNYIYIWGAQFELGSFASSYIPTTASTVTRAADTVTSIGGLNTIFSNLPQSAVVDLIIYQGSVSYSRIIGDSASVASIMQIQNADNSFAMDDGSAHGLIGGSGTAAVFTTGLKVGSCQDGSGRSLVGGGETVVSDAFSHAIADAKIGSSGGLHPNVFGYFRRITAWTSRLVDATLQGFTAP